MPQLIQFGFLLFAAWLIRRDIAMRPGLSRAIWIPTIWVFIIASRPLSAWIGFGGATDTLDGSPMDRLFYMVMIAAALVALSKRNLNWGWLIGRNWPVLLFYAFLLFSVLWANSLESSFKRWVKEAGNIFIALVILSEVDPLQAIRAVFVRCAIVLVPLSEIYIRYFPDIGRRYNMHSGEMEATGVTTQKNNLGTMLMVCGIIFVWDWLERTRSTATGRTWIDRAVAVGIASLTIYLFFLCDSKTSMVAMAVAALIITAIRLPVFRNRVSAFGLYGVLAVVAFFVVDREIGITERIVTMLGRDMTFTGRTLVWEKLFGVGTDPLLGTGFMSFWDDFSFRAKLPYYVAFSAHNGYIEVYLAGGVIGCFFLGLMLLGTGFIMNADLRRGGDYAVVRFAILVATLIANFFESNFACMTPLGFLFLLAAIGYSTPENYATANRAADPPAAPAADEEKPAPLTHQFQ